jgi:hypothetical protein
MATDTPVWGKDEISREILNYLADHPEASDTFDGIVQWWLLERKICQTVQNVRNALEDLVARGLLTEQSRSDKPVYRINAARNGASFAKNLPARHVQPRKERL